MHALILLFILSSAPSMALASDPTGLVYVGALQILLFSWPLILPLPYLRPQKNKLHAWFLFVIFAYGSLGVFSLPQTLLMQFGAWSGSEGLALDWLVQLNLAHHVLAFAFCLWYLPRFRRLLRLEQLS